MRIIYNAETGETYEDPNDETIELPQMPEPGPTMQEQIAALQEAVELLVLDRLNQEVKNNG